MLSSIKKIIPKRFKEIIKKSKSYKNFKNYKLLKGRNDKLVWSDNEDLKVLFIVQRIEVFTSSLPVVYEAIKRGHDVSILVSPRFIDCNSSFDLEAQNKTIKTIYGWDIAKKVKLLEAYNFEKQKYNELTEIYDYIFVNLPYAWMLPPNYDFKILRKHGQLCFLPYGYGLSDNAYILRGVANDYFLQQVNYHFATNELDFDFMKPLYKQIEEKGHKEILYNVGFPRFELNKDAEMCNQKFTILWIPRWTSASKQKDNLGGSFLKYKDDFIKFALSHKECNFVLRPHPLMFDNYIANGLITREEYQALLNTINNSDNLSLDDGPSYLETFNKTNLLIADFSSIVAEFFIQNKPILYTGKAADFGKRTAYITKSFYFVNSFDDIENNINDIIKGLDNKSLDREKMIKEFWKNNEMSASKNILDLLETDKKKLYKINSNKAGR